MKLYSQEAEEAVLASIIQDYQHSAEYIDKIKPEYFYSDQNMRIFLAIKSLHEEGIAVDLTTVVDKLNKQGVLSKIGGAYYVSSLVELNPSPAMLGYYVGILNEYYQRRKLKSICNDVTTQVEQQDLNVNLLKANLVDSVLSLEQTEAHNGEFIPPEQIVKRRKEGLIQRIKGFYIGTGYEEIDKYLTYGFAPGQISVICGRPRSGKSAFKCNLIRNQCSKGYSILNVTPEMGFDSEMDRFTALESGLSIMELGRIREWAKVEDGKIIPEHPEKIKIIKETTEQIQKWKLYFRSGVVNLATIRSDIIRILQHDRLDIVYIDLFDRIAEVRSEIRNKPQQITKCIGYLDNLAKIYNVHMCLLVQLRRDVEKRADKRPTLADLKESGSFEEEAWTIFSTYREALYNNVLQDNKIEISILKQRQGPAKSIELNWDSETLLISEEEGF